MAQSFLRNVIAAGFACVGIGLALHGGDARALVIEVNGSNYDVTTVSGSYDSLITTLSAQPWFGNTSLSYTFAETVINQLGLPNFNGGMGPIFAIGTRNVSGIDWVRASYFYSNEEEMGFVEGNDTVFTSQTATYAKAQLQPPAPSGVPGPLPVFGAMAGYGMSRRLRARIQAASPKPMGC
ncbi:MAG: hypothetical protein ACK5N0_03260 [Synechococcaceae cyanobacterium]